MAAKTPTMDKKEKTAGKMKSTKPVKKRINQRETISTFEGYPLTAQEARFIDEYCVTGNGRQSYMEAYPDSNPKNAHQNAYRLLNKAYIASEINHRLQVASEESIASATEIMNYFSAVMRGEIKDQFGLEASLSERTKAAVELAKRQIDIPQRLAETQQQQQPPEIKITLDWARPVERPKTVAEIMGRGLTEEDIAKYEEHGDSGEE